VSAAVLVRASGRTRPQVELIVGERNNDETNIFSTPKHLYCKYIFKYLVLFSAMDGDFDYYG
jgi:hypothetical protein